MTALHVTPVILRSSRKTLDSLGQTSTCSTWPETGIQTDLLAPGKLRNCLLFLHSCMQVSFTGANEFCPLKTQPNTMAIHFSKTVYERQRVKSRILYAAKILYRYIKLKTNSRVRTCFYYLDPINSTMYCIFFE